MSVLLILVTPERSQSGNKNEQFIGDETNTEIISVNDFIFSFIN